MNEWIYLILILILAFYLARYYLCKERPEFTVKGNRWRYFFRSTGIRQIIYNPWPLALTPFLQAITYGLVHRIYQLCSKFESIKEYVQLSDGGVICTEWFHFNEENNSTILLLPGLSGNSNELYVRNCVKQAKKYNYNIVMMNYRGFKASLKTKKIHNGGETEDCKEIVNYIYNKYCKNNKKLFAIGISLGATVLTNYICKENQNTPLSGCCPVGCHFDTFKAMNYLKTSLYGFYDLLLGYFCRQVSQKFIQQYDSMLLQNEEKYYGKLLKTSRMSGDYSQLISEMSGYSNIQNYFKECNVIEKLNNICIPTFFLSSKDDPLYGNTIPENIQNKNIIIASTKRGGHVCYFSGFIIPQQWFTLPCFKFINYLNQKPIKQNNICDQ